MHTLKLNVQDNVFEKVIYFLQNLPKNEVDDWSNLEPIIDEGLTSGVSPKSHEEIVKVCKTFRLPRFARSDDVCYQK